MVRVRSLFNTVEMEYSLDTAFLQGVLSLLWTGIKPLSEFLEVLQSEACDS